MPIYEYKCLACGAVKDLLVQGFKDPEGLACETCGSADLKRIISRTNYHQSHSARLDSYNPKAGNSESFLKDSRNIGLHAEHMLRQSGVKPTEEFQNKIEKLRTDPSRVLKD